MKINEIIAEDCQCSLNKWHSRPVLKIIERSIEKSWVEIYTRFSSEQKTMDAVRLLFDITLEKCQKVLANKKKSVNEGASISASKRSAFTYIENILAQLFKEISRIMLSKKNQKNLTQNGYLDPKSTLYFIYRTLYSSYEDIQGLLVSDTQIQNTGNSPEKVLNKSRLVRAKKYVSG